MAALHRVPGVTRLPHAGRMIHPSSITSRKGLPFVSEWGEQEGGKSLQANEMQPVNSDYTWQDAISNCSRSVRVRVESSPCRCSQPGDKREQYRRVWSCGSLTCSSCPCFSAQLWTERAKGQTGDAADLKKRKRAGGEGGTENENRPAESDESSAKKKKSVDPSKLSAFAFSKNWRFGWSSACCDASELTVGCHTSHNFCFILRLE